LIPDRSGRDDRFLLLSAWPVGLVIVIPLTAKDRGFAHHVSVTGPGLARPSFAMPEYARSVTQGRLSQWLGTADGDTLGRVTDWLRRMTGQA
jgi:mRNA interferase MazF